MTTFCEIAFFCYRGDGFDPDVSDAIDRFAIESN